MSEVLQHSNAQPTCCTTDLLSLKLTRLKLRTCVVQAKEDNAANKDLVEESNPSLMAEEVLMYHRATSRLLELCST